VETKETDMPIVVLDAMGVIYQACDDVAELLIPFLREKGCAAPDSAICDCYTECSLGVFESAVFWRRLGIEGEAKGLDQSYLGRHSLNSGLEEFCERMRKRSVALACISNDVSEWSRHLRRRFALEHRFINWTISGDIHCRKPDLAIFEHFIRTTNCSPGHCLYVDDRHKNLDAARRVGFHTLEFRANGSSELEAGRRVARNFREVEECALTLI